MASGDSLTDMRTTLLELIEDLRENVFTEPDEIGDLMLVEFFFKRMHPERIMEHIINRVLPWKKQVQERNRGFFLKNTSLFDELPTDRVSYYGEIIGQGDRLDSDDQKTVWEYFDTMIAIAENHRKVK